MASNSLINISSVFDGGKPKNVTGLSNLHFLMNTNIRDTLEDDYVLATNWTNNGSIVKSLIVP